MTTNIAYWTARRTPAEVAAAHAVSAMRAQRSAARCTDWTPPTGDTVHLVRVTQGERTCTRCGETFTKDARCGRCGATMHASVPTVAYLHSDEYRIVG